MRRCLYTSADSATKELVSVPLKYVGAEDEEAVELMLLAQLQRIGIGSGAFDRAPEVTFRTLRGRE